MSGRRREYCKVGVNSQHAPPVSATRSGLAICFAFYPAHGQLMMDSGGKDGDLLLANDFGRPEAVGRDVPPCFINGQMLGEFGGQGIVEVAG